MNDHHNPNRLEVHFGPIDIHLRDDGTIIDLLHQLLKQGAIMSKQLDDLKANVAAESTVIDSAITLLNGLSAQIAALKDDPVALQALADDVKTKSAALADAVTANTPAA